MGIRLGIDTGGTFTDVVVYNDVTGVLSFHKVHSTPDDPACAVLRGYQHGLDRVENGPAKVDLLVHGTTVATNTLLQRSGAKAALVTTAGFRDILQIQRQNRPHLYDLRGRRAEPLIPRCWRFELTERVGPDGSILVPVLVEELDSLITRLRKERIEAVAVAFLHSYENPVHEKQVGEAIRHALPTATVCTSHELAPQVGEYERFSTCAVNAYVQPIMERYVRRLDSALQKARDHVRFFVMKSNGGVMRASTIARQCVQTVLSGPAGGVIAGLEIARNHENSNLITADMGGTSFDVAVIAGGKASHAPDVEIEGLALRVPMLDIHTVGAGGGSVGWIDVGRALRVGPQSAGAVPGPACYGLGGTEPTITDANLVLGRLAVESTIADGMTLDLDAARRAIHDKLSTPLGISVEVAAEGMIRVVNTTMVAAIRKLTVERGLDPRTFVLCPFGGAGPLHGAELARECGIRRTLVPLAPGLTSAVGLLLADLREDIIATHIERLDHMNPKELRRMLEGLKSNATVRLQAPQQDLQSSTSQASLAIRYVGQSHDLSILIQDDELRIPQIANAFHEAHERTYGFCRTDQPLELVSLWVSVSQNLPQLNLPLANSISGQPAPVRTRPVVFDRKRYETPIFHRNDLGAGSSLIGPAIIEQSDTTTVVWPSEQVFVDAFGQLVLERIAPN